MAASSSNEEVINADEENSSNTEEDDPCVLEGCNFQGDECVYCGQSNLTDICELCGMENAVARCEHCDGATICDDCFQYCNCCQGKICSCCVEEGREAMCFDLKEIPDENEHAIHSNGLCDGQIVGVTEENLGTPTMPSSDDMQIDD